MRRRVPATLLTAIVLASSLAACSDDDDVSGRPAWGAGSAPSEPAPASSPTPDLRAATLAGDLASTVAARARYFPAGNVAEFVTAGSDVGTLADLGCFAAADDNGPNPQTPVDCSQPHLGEKFASVSMDDTWPADISAYVEGGAARERWISWGDAQCAQMLSQAIGGDGAVARALGVDGPLHPTFDGFYGWGINREQWDAGTKATECWIVATGDAPPSGRWSSTLLSSDRPNEVSYCQAGGGSGTNVDVRCDKPHWLEWTFATDVLPALGQQFVNSVDPNNPTDEQYQVINQFCGRALVPLTGSQRDDLRMLGYFGASSWGVGGRYLVWCTIAPADPALEVAGSAIGVGDAQLQFTPYPG
jgi:hypothetical protein